MPPSAKRRGRGEGSLFYRSDRDRWVGRVIIDGQPRTVSAPTKSEARRELDALRRSVDDGLPLTAGTVTVAGLLEVWADKALPNRNLSPSRHRRPHLGDQDPQRGARQHQVAQAHRRPDRGGVPAANQADRRQEAEGSRPYVGRRSVSRLADQTSLDAQSGPDVGTATKPRRSQRRCARRDPRRQHPPRKPASRSPSKRPRRCCKRQKAVHSKPCG